MRYGIAGLVAFSFQRGAILPEGEILQYSAQGS
jgi:hypothetical protein